MLPQKRKAIFLVILVMLHSCNVHSNPIQSSPDQPSSNTTEQASVTTVAPKADTNHASGGAFPEGNENAGSILQPTKVRLKQPGSKVATTGLLKWLNDTLEESGIMDTIPAVNCENITDDFFENSMQTIPIAKELYRILMLVLYVGNGCREKSLTVLREMRKDFDDEDSLAELMSAFLEGLQEGLDYTLPNNTRRKRSVESGSDFGLIHNTSIVEEVAPKNQTSVSILLEDISTRIRVIESLMYETAAKPKLCRWNMLSTTHCEEIPSSRKYTSLSDAQVRCEAVGRDCIGVEEHVTLRTYYLVNHCRYTRKVVQNDKKLVWVKDCENILGTSAHYMNTRHKRDISPTVYAKLYMDANYRGDLKTVTGALYYVGDDFNERISSLSCDYLCTVIVFQHSGFTGWQLAFENRTSFVGDQFDDAISSVVVLPYLLSDLCYVLYNQANYSGQERRVCGDVQFSSPVEIASIELLCTGCSVIFYTKEFLGSFTSFTSSKGYIEDAWRRQKIRSVQVRPWQTEGYEGHMNDPVHFYEYEDFTGARFVHDGRVGYLESQQNDKFSSFRCFGQCNVLAFEQAGFKGDAFLYQNSERNLENTDFNDKISSLLVLPYSICVTVYEHSYYRGRSQRYCEDSLYLVSSNWGDRISSLDVECDHCSVIVYGDPSFKGKYKAFTGKVSYVGKEWDDMVSSIQIRPWLLDDYEGCTTDEEEAKAYEVIQWIPIFSWLYSLCSSIYYAAKGCTDIAKSRAIDMAIDVGLDIIAAAVSVVTSGTGTAAVLGIKTAIKGGVKAGVKVFGKALAAGAKVGLKNGIKAIKYPLGLGNKGMVKKSGGQLSAVIKMAKEFGKTVFSKITDFVKEIAHVFANAAGEKNITIVYILTTALYNYLLSRYTVG